MTCWVNDKKITKYESSTVLGTLLVAFETLLNSHNVKWTSIYNGKKPFRSIYDVEDNDTDLICSLYLSYWVQTHSHFWPLFNTQLWNQCIYSRNKGCLENCTHFVECSCWQRHWISSDDVFDRCRTLTHIQRTQTCKHFPGQNVHENVWLPKMSLPDLWDNVTGFLERLKEKAERAALVTQSKLYI